MGRRLLCAEYETRRETKRKVSLRRAFILMYEPAEDCGAKRASQVGHDVRAGWTIRYLAQTTRQVFVWRTREISRRMVP